MKINSIREYIKKIVIGKFHTGDARELSDNPRAIIHSPYHAAMIGQKFSMCMSVLFLIRTNGFTHSSQPRSCSEQF